MRTRRPHFYRMGKLGELGDGSPSGVQGRSPAPRVWGRSPQKLTTCFEITHKTLYNMSRWGQVPPLAMPAVVRVRRRIDLTLCGSELSRGSSAVCTPLLSRCPSSAPPPSHVSLSRRPLSLPAQRTGKQQPDRHFASPGASEAVLLDIAESRSVCFDTFLHHRRIKISSDFADRNDSETVNGWRHRFRERTACSEITVAVTVPSGLVWSGPPVDVRLPPVPVPAFSIRSSVEYRICWSSVKTDHRRLSRLLSGCLFWYVIQSML